MWFFVAYRVLPTNEASAYACATKDYTSIQRPAPCPLELWASSFGTPKGQLVHDLPKRPETQVRLVVAHFNSDVRTE